MPKCLVCGADAEGPHFPSSFCTVTIKNRGHRKGHIEEEVKWNLTR